MIEYIVPLLESFLPMWSNYLIYLFAGSFVAFCGCFIHSLVRR